MNPLCSYRDVFRHSAFVLTALALVTGMGLGLAGCNGQEPSSPPTNDRSSETTTQQEPQSLFDGKTPGQWKIAAFGGTEDLVIEQGEIRVAMGYPLAGIVYAGEDFPSDHYCLELDAKKIQGTDFFCCLTFPVRDQFCSFVVGGWGGTVTGISCIDQQDASDNATQTLKKYHVGQWYHIRVTVAGDKLGCWIDDEQVVDLDLADVTLSLRTEVLPCKPLGICSFSTEAAYKNISYVRLPAASKSVAPAGDKKK